MAPQANRAVSSERLRCREEQRNCRIREDNKSGIILKNKSFMVTLGKTVVENSSTSRTIAIAFNELAILLP